MDFSLRPPAIVALEAEKTASGAPMRRERSRSFSRLLNSPSDGPGAADSSFAESADPGAHRGGGGNIPDGRACNSYNTGMPFCPQCRREFPNATECKDCKVNLVPDLPTEDWVEIFEGVYPEAMAVRGALESAEIETVTSGEIPLFFPDARTMGVSTIILVPKQDLAHAREIVKGLEKIESDELPPEAPEEKA